jgi:regulator of RNase E activity RraA
VIADGDAVLVVARAEWPEIAARARALEAEEDGLRAALARGERLGDLLALDLDLAVGGS